jgi:hypothetical protein
MSEDKSDKIICPCGGFYSNMKNKKTHLMSKKHTYYETCLIAENEKKEPIKEPILDQSELENLEKDKPVNIEYEDEEKYVNNFIKKLEQFELEKLELDDKFIDILNDYKNMNELQERITKKLKELTI